MARHKNRKPVEVKANLLKVDYRLYPRTSIDDHNVAMIAEAMRAGAEMPPIIIDKKSMRIVDGTSRTEAAKMVQGEQATLMAIFKSYRNDGEIFYDAMFYNNSHGKQLDRHDRVHCILRAEQLGMNLSAVAKLLHMERAKVEDLMKCRVAYRNKQKVAIKAIIGHMSGQQLTETQWQEHKKLGGNSQLFFINGVIRLLQHGFFDGENEQLCERLYVLKSEIDKWIGHGKKRKKA